MKKVTVFGVGNIGARVAFFLARSRDISRIVLVDVDPGRSRATLLDFLRSNVALRSRISFSDYDEPKEIDASDVVIVAAGVEGSPGAALGAPTQADLDMMDEIAAHVGHFAPGAMVAVVSQPAELYCPVIVKSGHLDPARVIGFPLLIYREWFRDQIARRVGVSSADVRITTVRTLSGEELVSEQCSVGGIPLTSLTDDLAGLSADPGDGAMTGRLRHHHYSPAAVIAEVTGELVSKRRQVITCVAHDASGGGFFETKAVVGPSGVERLLALALDSGQRQRHEQYRARVAELTRAVAPR